MFMLFYATCVMGVRRREVLVKLQASLIKRDRVDSQKIKVQIFDDEDKKGLEPALKNIWLYLGLQAHISTPPPPNFYCMWPPFY